MPRGRPYVSPEQRRRNEEDCEDQCLDSDPGEPDSSPGLESAAASPSVGRTTRKRTLPRLPATPGNDDAPFPDDGPDTVLHKTLDEHREKAMGKGKTTGAKRGITTQNQYGNAARKWWPAFLKAAKWDANDKFHFVDAQGNIRDGTFR